MATNEMNDTNKTTLTLAMPAGIRTFAEYQTVAQGLAAAQLGCSPSDISLEFPQQVKATASLTVTVRPAGVLLPNQHKQDQAWLGLRALGLAAVAVCALACAVYGWRLANQRAALEAQTTTATSQMAALKKSLSSSKVLAKTISPLAAASVLATHDLNLWMSAIEEMTVPQVSLKQLTLDTSAQAAQVTYELNQAAQVTSIGEALGSVHRDIEWTLKNLSEKQAVWQGRLK